MNHIIRRALEAAAASGDEEAKAYLARPAEARRRRLVKTLPRRQADDFEAGREQERHRRLVAEVMRRAAGVCELCGKDGSRGLEPHHLEPGRSKAQHERVQTVMAVHRDCHEAAQLAPPRFVQVVLAWAKAHGYPTPKRRIYLDAAT